MIFSIAGSVLTSVLSSLGLKALRFFSEELVSLN